MGDGRHAISLSDFSHQDNPSLFLQEALENCMSPTIGPGVGLKFPEPASVATALQWYMFDFLIQPPKPLAFIADAMLGRLARWLRILGYDTFYDKVITDERLIERALREDRWLLTRDRRLVLRKLLRGRHTLIASDMVEGQLRQLHRDLKIDLDMSHQRDYRCADCNVVLRPISYDEAVPLVPPFVARQYQEFLQCPQCRKVFWPGTHWQDLLRRVTAIKESGTDTAGARSLSE
jgi:uncharacterized protein with PIN domain